MTQGRRPTTVEYGAPRRDRSFPPLGCALTSAAVGLLPLLLGLAWLYTFIFTDRRAHLRVPGIFAGLGACFVAFCLIAIPFLMRSGSRRDTDAE